MSKMEEQSKEKEEIILFRVLIVGNSTVGKTSFLLRFCEDKFEEEALTTIGVDHKKKFILRNNKKYKLNICDTAGQERFRSLAKNLFKGADGIILMYDITQLKTFQELKNWITSIKDNVNIDKIGLVVVGNKIDLQDKREVNEDIKKNLEEKQNIKIIETSAKNNTNVNETFIELIDKMEALGLGKVQQNEFGDNNEDENGKIKINSKQKKATKKGCCGGSKK